PQAARACKSPSEGLWLGPDLRLESIVLYRPPAAVDNDADRSVGFENDGIYLLDISVAVRANRRQHLFLGQALLSQGALNELPAPRQKCGFRLDKVLEGR